MKKIKSFNTKKLIGIAVLAVVLIAVFIFFPQKSVVNKYMMKVINEGFIYFIAVCGLSVVLGMGGQVTFSTAAMMGVGAYTTAYLSTALGMHTLLALLIAMVVGTLFSWVVGLALFRLKGSYFAFASIGFAQLMATIYTNWMEVTGGPDGITKIPDLNLGIFECSSYYDYFRVLFVIAIISFIVIERIRRTYLGRALASVRDNELAAETMGINPYRTKVISFIIAGAFATLAGAIYALQSGYISPDPFKFDQSAIYLIMAMLGGVQSTSGAFLGAMLLTILPEKMRFLANYYKLIYGVGVIVLMVVMPMGLTSLFKKWYDKLVGWFKKRAKKQPVATEEGGAE